MNVWLFIAAINGFLAVALGAFAIHGLSGRIDAHALQIFETAGRYHMYHALAMGLAALNNSGCCFIVMARWSAGFFLGGIVLFWAWLYLFALTGFRLSPS